MKLLKQFFNWIKSLFTKQKTTHYNSNTKGIREPIHPIKTMKQKRNEWLSSKGYTPREVVKSTKVKVRTLSHYDSMVLAFARAKRKGAKVYDNGLKGINRKLIRNKQGIPFYSLK